MVDEELVGRVRAVVDDVVRSPDLPARKPGQAGQDGAQGAVRAPTVSERRMFGGVAFLLDGSMAVAVSGRRNGLMVRVPPDERADLLARPEVEAVRMRDAEMRGWVLVAAASLDDAALREWALRGCAVAAELPPRSGSRRRGSGG